MWSEMYQRGYDNAAISFAYIPDFKNIQDKKDFERGLKEGFEYKPMVTPQKVIPWQKNNSKNYSNHAINAANLTQYTSNPTIAQHAEKILISNAPKATNQWPI